MASSPPPARCQLTAQVAWAEISASLGSPCPFPNRSPQPQISTPTTETPGQHSPHERSGETPASSPPTPKSLGPQSTVFREHSRQAASGALPRSPQWARGAQGGPGLPRPQRRGGQRSEPGASPSPPPLRVPRASTGALHPPEAAWSTLAGLSQGLLPGTALPSPPRHGQGPWRGGRQSGHPRPREKQDTLLSEGQTPRRHQPQGD